MKIETWFKCVFFAVLSICAIVLTVDLHRQTLTANLDKRFDAIGERLASRDAQLSELLKDVKESFDANYDELHAQAETTTVILRQTSDLLSDAHAGALGGKDAHGVAMTGLLPELTKATNHVQLETIPAIDETVKATKPAVETLNADLGKFGTAIDASTQLIQDARTQTLPPITVAADNLSKASAELVKTGENVTATTGSVKEVAETADIVTRPYRKAGNRFKAFITWVAGRFVKTF